MLVSEADSVARTAAANALRLEKRLEVTMDRLEHESGRRQELEVLVDELENGERRRKHLDWFGRKLREEMEVKEAKREERIYYR